ncbi:hypothetical protein [Aurantiacibacter sediminis]|uniref:Peptidase A2 domain-containing protein n=1 Tax=Aurantiacibacter sediminis TaxID=2793064 RepID=A0ABS0N4D5_9SPHN|nr:hypothetical protein [Aurantiacibacter sediminis]MBH5322817.1 hypothetical protein [Aurantiacibacter sediminis]
MPLKWRDTATLALVDTGASVSVFPRKMVVGETIIEHAKVATRFGMRREPLIELDGVDVDGRRFDCVRALAVKRRTSLVGLQLLMAHDTFWLGREGIGFACEAPQGDVLTTAEVRLLRDDPAFEQRVTGLSLLLELDGRMRECFFDTGRTTLLAASAFLESTEQQGSRGFDLHYNGLGEFGLARYHRRSARIRLGSWSTDIKYRHHHADKTFRQPFVLGGGILKHFDVHVAIPKLQATFYPSGTLSGL